MVKDRFLIFCIIGSIKIMWPSRPIYMYMYLVGILIIINDMYLGYNYDNIVVYRINEKVIVSYQ